MTIFGVSPPGGEHDEHRTRYSGTLGYPRFFYGPGKRYGWNLWPLTNRQAGDIPVVSVKTWNEADFVAMLATGPLERDGGWWFCFAHEPEDEIMADALTVEQMRVVYTRARELIDASSRKGCQLLLVLNWYQLSQRGFDARRFDPLMELVDAVGVDSYALAEDALRRVYTAPGDLFGPAVAISDRWGLPWCVPEFAVRMASDWDRRRHARMLGRYATWARAHGALWVSYWCNPAGGYTEHICTDPMYSDAFATWRTLVADSRVHVWP